MGGTGIGKLWCVAAGSLLAAGCTAAPVGGARPALTNAGAKAQLPRPKLRAAARAQYRVLLPAESPVQPGHMPFHVSLFRTLDGHFCSGTIIDPQWILTAAHCLSWLDGDAGFHVAAGTTDLAQSGQVIEVRRVVLHPQYDDESLHNDLALVELARPLTVSAQVAPLSAFALDLPASQQLTGTGLVAGYVAPNGERPDGELWFNRVELADNATCNAPGIYGGAIIESMLCAGGDESLSCVGDGGSPLVTGEPGRFTLVGVASFGEGCVRPLKYGVFTRVASFADWIRTTIGK